VTDRLADGITMTIECCVALAKLQHSKNQKQQQQQ